MRGDCVWLQMKYITSKPNLKKTNFQNTLQNIFFVFETLFTTESSWALKISCEFSYLDAYVCDSEGSVSFSSDM